MAKFINLYDAKTRLSELVDRAAAGEEIVIAKAGKPVARLVPLRARTRTPGRGRGKIHASDDFDAPLPNTVLREFGLDLSRGTPTAGAQRRRKEHPTDD